MSKVDLQPEVQEWRSPQEFDTRAQSENATIQELIEAVQYANGLKKTTIASGPPPLRFTWIRALKEDGDKIRLQNDSDQPVIFVYTQELVKAMLSRFSGEFGAGPAEANLKADIERELVSKTTVTSILTLPKQTKRDVIIGDGYALVSTFVDRNGVISLLHSKVLITQGYRHIVAQDDVDNALRPELLELLKALEISN